MGKNESCELNFCLFPSLSLHFCAAVRGIRIQSTVPSPWVIWISSSAKMKIAFTFCLTAWAHAHAYTSALHLHAICTYWECVWRCCRHARAPVRIILHTIYSLYAVSYTSQHHPPSRFSYSISNNERICNIALQHTARISRINNIKSMRLFVKKFLHSFPCVSHSCAYLWQLIRFMASISNGTNATQRTCLCWLHFTFKRICLTIRGWWWWRWWWWCVRLKPSRRMQNAQLH